MIIIKLNKHIKFKIMNHCQNKLNRLIIIIKMMKKIYAIKKDK
jgi:hypothetical protein